MELAPMNNLCALVNENLRDCPEKTCKGTKLQLELDWRIGFASTSTKNKVNYLKRKRDASTDKDERRRDQKEVSRLNLKI